MTKHSQTPEEQRRKMRVCLAKPVCMHVDTDDARWAPLAISGAAWYALAIWKKQAVGPCLLTQAEGEAHSQGLTRAGNGLCFEDEATSKTGWSSALAGQQAEPSCWPNSQGLPMTASGAEDDTAAADGAVLQSRHAWQQSS